MESSNLENEKKEEIFFVNWNAYLKETNSIAAPESCFKNVDLYEISS